MTQAVDLGRLQRNLANSKLRFDLRSYAQVGSTQDLVESAARAGAEEGLVVFADEQLAGRGRSGQTWTAPAGSSLMFSILLRPPSVSAVTTLGLVAGLALVEGLARAGGPTGLLKWPNDCLCSDRKLAGVLAESHRGADGRFEVVVGIGCNVSWRGRELPSGLADIGTACDLEGKPVDRTALAEAVLDRLAVRYREWAAGGFTALKVEWLGRAAWIGEEVIAWRPEGMARGRLAGVSDRGELLLDAPGGRLAIAAGEMTRSGAPQLRRA
ncbi:MAG TPA: biotin--[acetyl-CoA-carboxylase] ligase [Candidatus Dormibacteraeota bacterium]